MSWESSLQRGRFDSRLSGNRANGRARGDLLQFTAHCDGELAHLTADPIRAFLADIGELSPATRKRKRAAVSSFCKWAVRHDLLGTNPMDKIDTIKVPKTLPCPAPPRPTTSPRC